ncbi:MurR/RpiR family transcriptional regulator [Allopusillimonas ginsengisoli]|uniref:MurR/RpiR family transcriptional regulator n=1 Tax=Allopusillimonas ginsengisoli TaxID=453575 RepID=UPI0039C10B6B
MTQTKNQAPATLDAFTARVQQGFAEMTPQFQVGAKYLLDFPAEVPVASMRSIATQAGVQPATLVRLAQSLGYAGWGELKKVFLASLRSVSGHYAERASSVVGDQSRSAAQSAAIQAGNVHMLADVNAQNLPEAVRMLTKARNVHVAGFRASFAPAHTFQYLYRLFRPTVMLIRGDAGTLDMDLRGISKGDVTVIIAFAPYSHEALLVAEAARRAQSRVLAICDSVVAPMALQADCVLQFSTDTPSFFPSSVAALSLVEILIEQLLAQAGPRAVNSIRQAEGHLQQDGAYLNPSHTTAEKVNNAR